MKTSKESAVEWLNRITSGDIVKDITGWIEQDRAEQREACGKKAAYAAWNWNYESGATLMEAVESACLDARIEE